MPAKQVFFAMCDLLRWDGLSCCGLKRLHVCGTSRVSTDTGRYGHTHGAGRTFLPIKASRLFPGFAIGIVGLSR